LSAFAAPVLNASNTSRSPLAPSSSISPGEADDFGIRCAQCRGERSLCGRVVANQSTSPPSGHWHAFSAGAALRGPVLFHLLASHRSLLPALRRQLRLTDEKE